MDVRAVGLSVALLSLGAGCLEPERGRPDAARIDSVAQGVTDPVVRRARSEAIRDIAASMGMTNGALLAGIAQVETGLSHCWSEATWACQGPDSPSCGGPVIAGAADGPCSDQQGGLGMFQFDGGTYAQTLARDGEDILLLEGNIAHAVEFVAERVRQERDLQSAAEAIEWINTIPIEQGDPVFEEWIALVACRYNGCCGCTNTQNNYRNATLNAAVEFEPGFWDAYGEIPTCQPIGATGATLEENDPCAVAGGSPQYWRVETAGSGGRLLWTHTTDNAAPANFGVWNLEFEWPGVYRLEVSTDGGTFAQSKLASYLIRHAGSETVAVIDQSAVDGWQVLAELEFAAGGQQSVRVDDNTGEPNTDEVRLVFDALRVVAVDVDDGTDDPPPPDDEDPTNPGVDDGETIGGGCRAAPRAGAGAGAWVMLLGWLAAGVRRRRRRARP